ncbi:MAG: hypothetical protein MUF71_10185 [Candidatus Kapabacteria bacterium]|jgi:hypothetical protein|nr:hypothetical protein [Candidatus Kapabacteria bacterium]
MKFHLPKTYTPSNILRGASVYAVGDSIAMLILGEFLLVRMFGMMTIGAGVYALEIPAYFAWIARKTAHIQGWRGALARTALAWVYFNPLWIARHLAFGKILSGTGSEISSALLVTAWYSFLGSIPISLLGNFFIQNVLPEKHRFLGSAIFSGLTAIYYALSSAWFS